MKDNIKLLINVIGVDYNNYYDKRNNQILFLNNKGEDVEGNLHHLDELYEFPYRESARKYVWKEFHNRLTDEQKNLFPDYEHMLITWRDVIEADLDTFFYEVEEDVLIYLLNTWQKENHLSIDWDTLNNI